ncbi:MAG: AsmA family protein [Shimia sp.]|uniref:AsmA family protein n=1 Tax=Shimia sp. TaxID=1954381 RepID=UPI003B8D4B4B
MKVLRALGLSLVAALLLGTLGLWWALTGSQLENWWRQKVEQAISSELGYPVEIVGDLQFEGLPKVSMRISQVHVGDAGAAVHLAELPSLTLTIDVPKLLTGRIDFSKIRAEGLRLNFVTERNGTKTWVVEGQPEEPRLDRLIDHSVAEYLISRDAEFSNFSLYIENKISGFVFDGSISEFSVHKDEAEGRSQAAGRGTINGLPFDLEGTYDRETGATAVNIGTIRVRFDGQLLPQGEPGYEGDLTVDVGDLGDVFDVLKLDSQVHGQGALVSKLRRASDVFQLTDLRAEAETVAGSKVTLTGAVDDLLDLSGLNLRLDTQHSNITLDQWLVPGAEDLSLESVSSFIKGSASKIELSDVEFEVNSRSRGVESFGPFSVGEITREDDNTLHLSGLDWTFSDDNGTRVSFHGEVHDLLAFRDYRLEGGGVVSLADLALTAVSERVLDIGLGRFSIVLSDAEGTPGVDAFEVTLDGTQGWDLNVSGFVPDVGKLTQAKLEFFIRSDGRNSLAEALEVPDHLLGTYEVAGEMGATDHGFGVSVNATVDRSKLSADLSVSQKTLVPEVRGELQSEILDVAQLGHLAAWIRSKVKQQANEKPSAVLQPLRVLPGAERLRIPGRPAVRSMVIENAPAFGGAWAMGWLGKSNIRLQAVVKRLVGVSGVRSIESDIVVDRGVLSVGPISFDGNGQRALVNAEIDLIRRPNQARLHGKILGWTLQGLTSFLGLEVAAQGNVSTSFDLTGNVQSLEGFLRSSSGHVALRLKEGRIASSLLKLAGHGVLPWLFSDELARGTSNVSCIVFPIRLNGGVASIQGAALETDATQLVVDGEVDFRSGQIQARGEPRPLGMPFEPSPYPFEVSGSLTEPDFKLLDQIPRVGKKRLRVINRQPCRPDGQQVRGR